MKMYKIPDYFGIGIEEVEVIKRTKNFVVINRNGSERRVSSDCYFLTKEDAKEGLIKRLDKKVFEANKDLERAQRRLNEAVEELGNALLKVREL